MWGGSTIGQKIDMGVTAGIAGVGTVKCGLERGGDWLYDKSRDLIVAAEKPFGKYAATFLGLAKLALLIGILYSAHQTCSGAEGQWAKLGIGFGVGMGCALYTAASCIFILRCIRHQLDPYHQPAEQ